MNPLKGRIPMASNEGMILIDQVEPPVPQVVQHPQRPISYNPDAAIKAPRVRLPAQAWLIITSAVLVPIAVGLYFFVQWMNDRPWFADTLGYAVVAVALAFLTAGGWAAIGWARSFAQERHYQAERQAIERTRWGGAVHVDDLRGMMPTDPTQVPVWLGLERLYTEYEAAGWPYKQNPMLITRTGGDTKVDTTLGGPPATAALPAPTEQLPTGMGVIDGLLAKGWIARSGHSLMVGTDEAGRPHYIDLTQSPSIAVAGASQFGKSSFVRFAMAQLALMPGPTPIAIVLCDPHGKINERSLAVSCAALEPALATPPALDRDDILATIHRVVQLGQARLDGTEPIRSRMVLVIDEVTSLMDQRGEYSAELAQLLRRFGNEFGKVAMNVIMIGQSWNADLAGGTALRNSIQSLVIYGIKQQQARFLLNPDEARQAELLPKQTGDILFKGHWADETRRIRVPWVSQDDLDAVREKVHKTPEILPELTPAGSQPVSPALTELRTRISQTRRTYPAATREQIAAKALASTQPPRVRNRWAYRVKDIARELQMSDAEIAIIAAEVGRGGQGEG